MAQSQNTVRELLIGSAVATETTLDTFKDSASPGEVGIFSQDGTALAQGKPFVVAQKTADSVFVSDVIFPKQITSVTDAEYKAEEGREVTVSGITVEVGNDYIIDLYEYEHGSFSREDVYIKFGAYRAVTGDTASNIVDGLIASLNRNYSREPGATPTSNKKFTFTKTGTGASSALVITAKAQPYVRGKKGGRGIYFDVLAKFEPASSTVTVTKAGHPGQGTGKLIASMEYDLRKNRGDLYGDQGWPYTFGVVTRADEGANYDMIDITHHRGHDGWNDVKMRKVTSIAIVDGTGKAALLASIATATDAPAPVA